jgi:hypothetical protein
MDTAMLTIKNIEKILNTRYGRVDEHFDEWELININDMSETEYVFHFRREYKDRGNLVQRRQITMNRVGKFHTHVMEKVYECGGGLFTMGYLENKDNMKRIFEDRLNH